MSIPLLATKLSAPPLRRNSVVRQELIEKLNQGSGNGFVLISAPAGYGKTTLLSTWLEQVAYRYAWISLDTSDNDLARFLLYLEAALSKFDVSFGKAAIASIGLRPQFEIETLLTSLINQLAQTKQPLCLILDDYHVIQDQSVHQVVRFLLEKRPMQFQIVIATRTDPPLPLSKFRARSQMVEIRSTDLRFTTQEIAEFMGTVMSLDLSPTDLYLLETTTEGWIAGLQMAGQDEMDDYVWKNWAQMVKGLNQAGVPLMVGTDLSVPGIIPGFAVHDEMAIWQEAGIPAADILRSATLVPAEFMGLGDRLGSIREGKTASMVLVRANPLEDIQNAQKIDSVFLRGQYFSRVDLDQLLNEAKALAQQPTTP